MTREQTVSKLKQGGWTQPKPEPGSGLFRRVVNGVALELYEYPNGTAAVDVYRTDEQGNPVYVDGIVQGSICQLTFPSLIAFAENLNQSY